MCKTYYIERSYAEMYRRIRDNREDAHLMQKDYAYYLQYTQVSYSHY